MTARSKQLSIRARGDSGVKRSKIAAGYAARPNALRRSHFQQRSRESASAPVIRRNDQTGPAMLDVVRDCSNRGYHRRLSRDIPSMMALGRESSTRDGRERGLDRRLFPRDIGPDRPYPVSGITVA